MAACTLGRRHAGRGERIQPLGRDAAHLGALRIERGDRAGARIAFEFLRRAAHELRRRREHELSLDGLEPLRRGGGIGEGGDHRHLGLDRLAAGRWRTPSQQFHVEVLHARCDELHVHRALLPAAPSAVALLPHGNAEARVRALQPCGRGGEAGGTGESRSDGVDEHLAEPLDLRLVHPYLPHAADDRVGRTEGLRVERARCECEGEEEPGGRAHGRHLDGLRSSVIVASHPAVRLARPSTVL